MLLLLKSSFVMSFVLFLLFFFWYLVCYHPRGYGLVKKKFGGKNWKLLDMPKIFVRVEAVHGLCKSIWDRKATILIKVPTSIPDKT